MDMINKTAFEFFFQQRDCYVVLLRSAHTWWLTCDVFVYHSGSCKKFQREGKRTEVQLWSARTIEKSSISWWSGSLHSACIFLSEISAFSFLLSLSFYTIHGNLNSLKQCKKIIILSISVKIYTYSISANSSKESS